MGPKGRNEKAKKSMLNETPQPQTNHSLRPWYCEEEAHTQTINIHSASTR